MATTSRFKNHFLVFLFAALLLLFLGVAFANRAALAAQLDNWQVLPRPQGVTELYFVDDKQLPASVRAESIQNVAFTIHNREYEVTTYHYKLVVAEEGAAGGHAVGAGIVQLGHDEPKTIRETIKIPAVSKPRAAVRVEIEYPSVPFGSKTLQTQRQAIHYWANVVGLKA